MQHSMFVNNVQEFLSQKKKPNFKLMVLCEKKYVKNNKNLEKSGILWEFVWWHLESMSRTGSTRKMKKYDFFRFIYKEKKLTICRKSLRQSYICSLTLVMLLTNFFQSQSTHSLCA